MEQDRLTSKQGKHYRRKNGPTYTDVFADAMVNLGEEHDRLVGITAAMKEGTGLVRFEKKYPDRLFDVGIAEEHAVSFPEFGLKSFLCLCKKLLSYIYLRCEFCFVDKISSDTII